MRTNRITHPAAALLSLFLAGSLAAAEWATYKAKPGSTLTMEGTSTLHSWTVETRLIGGKMEVGPNFPLDPAAAKPGKVEAKAEAFLMVGSLKSGKKAMDDRMHNTLNQKAHPKIAYQLRELTLKAVPAAGAPLVFDSVGTLTVSGATRTNTMEISIEPRAHNQLVIKGSTALKMTDFGVTPPVFNLLLAELKTGDDLKISFEWVTEKAE